MIGPCVKIGGMPQKDPEAARKSRRDWAKRNPDVVRKHNKKNQPIYLQRNRDYVNEIKSRTPCLDCGVQYHPQVMEYDHVRGDKVDAVAYLVRTRRSIKVIQTEIDKCELVCANCHRMRTVRRRESE